MKCLGEHLPPFCNSIIRATLEKGSPKQALRQYNSMLRFGVLRPDHRTISLLLKACRSSAFLDTATAAHGRIIKSGFSSYKPLSTSLYHLYLVHGQIAEALYLFDGIPQWDPNPLHGNLLMTGLLRKAEFEKTCKVFNKMSVKDLVSWNLMIGGCVQSSRPKEALILFRKMVDSGFEPDCFTFSSALSACARVGALSHGEFVHRLMAEREVEFNHFLVAALIDMYAKCGSIEVARKLFEEMRRDNVSVWNSMITGLAIHGLGLDVLNVFDRMEVEGVAPDSITFVGVLTGCSHCGMVQDAQHYFDAMRRKHFVEQQIEHYGAMVDTLARAGHLDEAFNTIKAMPMEPDIVIWRALLSACRKHRRPDLGEVVIKQMAQKQSGDYVLLSSIYSSDRRYDHSEKVWGMMRENSIRKSRGLSWVEMDGKLYQFKAGDRSHIKSDAIYRTLDQLTKKVKAGGLLR